MRRSYNEISMTVKKAALGAGLEYGLAEDVGRAAHWLCARGHDGVAIAHAAIISAAGETACRYRSGVFAGAHAATAGPSALDLARTGFPVELENLDVPLLLAGLAGAEAGMAAIRFHLTLGDNDAIVISAGGPDRALDTLQPGADVCVSAEPLAQTGQSAAGQDSAGADVDETTWNRIEALAAKTYVPASDASRTRGAGAGLTDND